MGLDYLERAMDRPVYPTEEALAHLSQFDEALPEQSGDARKIISRLHEFGGPNTTAQIGGRYFGFVHGGIIPVGLAAKILASFWDQNASVYVSSPIASKLETVVQNWLVRLFGLPDNTVAGFVSGTSMAIFCALVAARYRLLVNQGWDVVKNGLYDAPKIRLVTGREAHSSMLQAISLAGFGTESIEWVDVDDQGRIVADQIPELDSSTILSLQAGNVQ